MAGRGGGSPTLGRQRPFVFVCRSKRSGLRRRAHARGMPSVGKITVRGENPARVGEAPPHGGEHPALDARHGWGRKKTFSSSCFPHGTNRVLIRLPRLWKTRNPLFVNGLYYARHFPPGGYPQKRPDSSTYRSEEKRVMCLDSHAGTCIGD